MALISTLPVIIIFFTRFLIEISDQTIEYVISRYPEKLTGVLSQKKRHSLKIPNNSNLC